MPRPVAHGLAGVALVWLAVVVNPAHAEPITDKPEDVTVACKPDVEPDEMLPKEDPEKPIYTLSPKPRCGTPPVPDDTPACPKPPVTEDVPTVTTVTPTPQVPTHAPEPGSLLLLGAGAVTLFLTRRR